MLTIYGSLIPNLLCSLGDDTIFQLTRWNVFEFDLHPCYRNLQMSWAIYFFILTGARRDENLKRGREDSTDLISTKRPSGLIQIAPHDSIFSLTF